MKKARTWNFGSIVGKILMGLVLAAMIGSIDVAPALGEDKSRDNHKRVEKHDNGRDEHRGRGNDRDRYVHGRRDYQPYGYAPPPVIYAPEPEPGISVFFPPIVINP
jgi:hypothetical protein